MTSALRSLVGELSEISDRYLVMFRDFRDAANVLERCAITNGDDVVGTLALYAAISTASHTLASEILELHVKYGADAVVSAFYNLPLHEEVLLRSAFIRRALEKPRGYAGDMELMQMICAGPELSGSLYDRLVNRVYLDLPASQAVRDRAAMLQAVLRDQPAGSRVLNVACGPAVEVQRLCETSGSTLFIDLLDHDPATLAYLAENRPGGASRLLRGNAFRMMAGDLRVLEHPSSTDTVDLRDEYDLIYSSGLYDYIPSIVKNGSGPALLTDRLFRLLRPGGRLLVGNFLTPGPVNAHRPHHRLMMELYSKWNLIYRSPDQIRQFTALLSEGDFSVRLTNEHGEKFARDGRGVIGFLEVVRNG